LAASNKIDNTPKVLAALGVLLFVVLIVFVATGSVTEGMRDGFWMLAGAAVSIVKDVYGYYFGSSKGSQNKDETISNLSK
jgi:CDP-diglyceride synthetase